MKFLEADKILKNWRRNILFLALICALILLSSGSASATSLNTTNLSNYSNIYVNVSNDEGVSFNTTGNGTYYIQNLSSPNGGFNAVHIANDSSYTLNYGGSTNTNNQSGTFYITDTGGRGYQDDGVLMLAVNGTIPDNFALHLIVNGYYWTPTGVLNAAPALSALHYGVTLDETFTKNDFLYGPQNWKPTGGNSNYPIFIGQDMDDAGNLFYLMFIDLHAGLLGSNYNGGDSQFINNGAIQVNYTFQNLQSLAAFNVYAWNWNTSQGQGMLWTNSILPGNTGGPSGYTVMGTPIPSASFTSSPSSDTNPLSVQFTDKSTGGAPLTYLWDFGDGHTSTEQNPVWTYSSSGTYKVTLTVTNEQGSNQITKNITVNSILTSASVSGGLYNTSLAVNLTSPDKNAQIYYTLDGSTPTTSSPCYTGPININSEGATTLKFIAVDGDLKSAVQTEVYTLDLTTPTVTVNPAGGNYNTAQNITLTTADNGNTTTYYTTDGTDPKSSNTRTVYSKPVQIHSSTTLKYAAVDAAGNWSPIYTADYNMVDITAPVASADIPSGSYTTNQNVALSAVDEMDPNPQIYYTLNGTTPTVNSTLYYLPVPINLVGTTVLRFIAVDNAGHVSDVITRVYFLDKSSVSGTWNSNLIDTNNIEYNSIAMDSKGYPHIAYYQNAISGGDPQLKYAYEDKNGWHIETVESSGSGSGAYVSLVLDSQGNPHLAYEDIFGGATPYMLRYAYRDSTGVWHISTLTTSYAGNTRGDQIEGINLVLYNDQPRISFYNDTGGKIEYMYQNGASWVTETVATNGGPYDSLALDSSGNPYISYYSISPQSGYASLRYAQRTADGIWKAVIVDNSAYYVGKWNSLALDSSGNPYISYIWNSTSLKLAYWNGTQWITETVSNLKSAASKLVLDQSNNPLIVYQDYISKNLEYAYKEGSKWIIINIDSANGAFGQISLALNASGVPNVSYESTDYNLRYAYLVPFEVNASLAGDTYNTTKMVNLISTEGTVIYYTKDGSDPRTSPTRIKYTSPIMVNNTMALQFAAEDSADNWSPIYTETYTIIDDIAPTASANIPSGLYNTAQSVVLSMSEIGSIYYTTNGDTPTTSSTRYTGPISVGSTTTLKFLAVDGVGNPSQVYTMVYTIDKTAPTASASVSSGSYNAAKNVTLKMSEAGTIYYTRNGAAPTTSSTKYTGLISITSSTTLKFLAVDSAGNKSPVYIVNYVIDKTAPKVSSTYPKKSTTGISRTKTMYIKFSESIKSSINWSKVYIKNLKTGKKVSISKSISGNTMYLKTGKRSAYTWYQIYIPASAIKDSAGNNLAAGYSFKFKTGRY